MQPEAKTFIIEPLVNRDNVLLPALNTKLGLMRLSIKVLTKMATVCTFVTGFYWFGDWRIEALVLDDSRSSLEKQISRMMNNVELESCKAFFRLLGSFLGKKSGTTKT